MGPPGVRPELSPGARLTLGQVFWDAVTREFHLIYIEQGIR